MHRTQFLTPLRAEKGREDMSKPVAKDLDEEERFARSSMHSGPTMGSCSGC